MSNLTAAVEALKAISQNASAIKPVKLTTKKSKKPGKNIFSSIKPIKRRDKILIKLSFDLIPYNNLYSSKKIKYEDNNLKTPKKFKTLLCKSLAELLNVGMSTQG